MSYEIGAIKYLINNLIFNYVPMYLFGGTIITLFTVLGNLGAAEFLPELIKTLTPTPSSLIINPLVGAPIAAFRWYASVV